MNFNEYQEKAKQTVVDIDTEKFFKEVEKQKRKEKGIENLKKAIKTGTTKSGESIDKIDREGKRDISTMNPDELRRRGIGGDGGGSTEGSAGGEGPKRQDQVVKFSSGAKGKFASGSPEMGGESKKFASRNRTPVKSFNQFKNEVPLSPTEVVTGPTKVDGKIDTSKSKPKKQKPTITRGRARKDKGFAPPPTPKEPSALAKAVEKTRDFAKKDPLFALGTYDLGKGVLGKILKVKSLAPGVRGGTVGSRSARGGGGL